MADDTLAPPRRLVNFVSQEETRQSDLEVNEDGTAYKDRPHLKILETTLIKEMVGELSHVESEKEAKLKSILQKLIQSFSEHHTYNLNI